MNKEKLKTILIANKELSSRMRDEDWDVLYDRQADLVVICGSLPKDSQYVPIGDEGFMVRMKSDDDKIYGFAIENFKHFASIHQDFKLMFMPLTNPVRFWFIWLILSLMQMITDIGAQNQREEAMEYISKEATFETSLA